MREKLKELKSELNKTSKGKAILRLCKWLIFFLCLFIFLAICSVISNNPNNANKTPNPSSIGADVLNFQASNSLFQKMRSKDFSYRVKIKSDGNYYQFTGKRTLTEEIGYKESNFGILKYAINNDGIFEDNLNGRIPISNLYENLKTEYLIWHELFTILGNMEYNLVDKSTKNTYVYNQKNGVLSFEITIEKKLVTNIKISKTNSGLDNYEYDFSLEYGVN